MAKKQKVSENSLYAKMPKSKFDGKLGGLIGTSFKCFFAALLVFAIGAGIFAAIYLVVCPMLGNNAMLQLILTIVGALPAVFFLVLGCAWAIIIRNRWICKHTYINGYRLKFTGKTWNLAFNILKWFFLTVVTLTIYGWVLPIKTKKWRVKHTVIDDSVFPEELLAYYEQPYDSFWQDYYDPYYYDFYGYYPYY